MKLYIAGPMSGYPEHNMPAFDTAKQLLAGFGIDCVSPADITRDAGIAYTQDGTSTPQQYADFMRKDIPQLMMCDGVFVLDNWSESKGAKFEVQLAQLIGLPIYRKTAKGGIEPLLATFNVYASEIA